MLAALAGCAAGTPIFAAGMDCCNPFNMIGFGEANWKPIAFRWVGLAAAAPGKITRIP